MYIEINKNDIKEGNIIKVKNHNNDIYIGKVERIIDMIITSIITIIYYNTKTEQYDIMDIDINDINTVEMFSDTNVLCIGYSMGGTNYQGISN